MKIPKSLIRALLGGIILSALSCDGDSKDSVNYPETPPPTVGGDRPALVYAPSDYDPANAYPLVVMLHGYSVNALIQDFIFGFKERVDRFDFVLITPEGTVDAGGDQFWNATDQCCDFGETGVDDVAYISGLIEEASRKMHIDPHRVAVTGHSNGGYMSYRMACERPDLVDRIGVLAGSVFIDPAECSNPGPVSVLHIHGTDDKTVPYNAETGEGFGISTVGAEASVRRWIDRDGCPTQPTVQSSADFLDSLPGEETEISSWSGCDSDKTVDFWSIVGGDHTLVGVNNDFRDRITEFLTH